MAYRITATLRTTVMSVLSVAILSIQAGPLGAAESATYELRFDATWSSSTHPDGFPSSPHFSPLVGGTHNQYLEVWAPGGESTPGIELMAETGSGSTLNREFEAAIDAGTSDQFLRGPGVGRSPAEVGMTFTANKDFPLLSIVSMLAPSPDWFVGTHGLDLRPDGEWLGQMEIPLRLYDAGTDSGEDYRSANADTSPQEPISVLSTGAFSQSSIVGSFRLLRLLEGDLTSDGVRTAADIDALADAIRMGSTDAQYDLNTDGNVNAVDHLFWVETLANTFLGDANLDGEFGSADLVTTFQAGEYEDDIAGNSTWAEGDFDGDGDFLSGDLVSAFATGAYENGARAAVAAVPEPSAFALLATSMFGLFGLSRKLRVK